MAPPKLGRASAPFPRLLPRRPLCRDLREGEVSFRLINPQTGNRVRQVMVDAQTGAEVDRKGLMRGFEIGKDRYVLLSEEEIRGVRLESTRSIDIERFVGREDIDRIWWDVPYDLVPSETAGVEAFVVIREALRKTGRIALGRVAMHARERLVAIEPRGEGLLVTTLRSHDDIRDAGEISDGIPGGGADPKMVAIAERSSRSSRGRSTPANSRPLRRCVARADPQQAGWRRRRHAGRAAAQGQCDRLMDALKRSLGEGGTASSARRRGGRRRGQGKRRQAGARAPRARPGQDRRAEAAAGGLTWRGRWKAIAPGAISASRPNRRRGAAAAARRWASSCRSTMRRADYDLRLEWGGC